MKTRWSMVGLLAVVVLATAWGLWERNRALRFEQSLNRSLADLRAGRFEEALPVLRGLAIERPEHDQVAFSLGICERSLGQPEAALDSWSRIDPTAEYGPSAVLASAELLSELGRLAEAERRLREAIDASPDGSGPELAMLRERLIGLLRLTGRRDELTL